MENVRTFTGSSISIAFRLLRTLVGRISASLDSSDAPEILSTLSKELPAICSLLVSEENQTSAETLSSILVDALFVLTMNNGKESSIKIDAAACLDVIAPRLVNSDESAGVTARMLVCAGLLASSEGAAATLLAPAFVDHLVELVEREVASPEAEDSDVLYGTLLLLISILPPFPKSYFLFAKRHASCEPSRYKEQLCRPQQGHNYFDRSAADSSFANEVELTVDEVLESYQSQRSEDDSTSYPVADLSNMNEGYSEDYDEDHDEDREGDRDEDNNEDENEDTDSISLDRLIGTIQSLSTQNEEQRSVDGLIQLLSALREQSREQQDSRSGSREESQRLVFSFSWVWNPIVNKRRQETLEMLKKNPSVFTAITDAVVAISRLDRIPGGSKNLPKFDSTVIGLFDTLLLKLVAVLPHIVSKEDQLKIVSTLVNNAGAADLIATLISQCLSDGKLKVALKDINAEDDAVYKEMSDDLFVLEHHGRLSRGSSNVLISTEAKFKFALKALATMIDVIEHCTQPSDERQALLVSLFTVLQAKGLLNKMREIAGNVKRRKAENGSAESPPLSSLQHAPLIERNSRARGKRDDCQQRPEPHKEEQVTLAKKETTIKTKERGYGADEMAETPLLTLLKVVTEHSINDAINEKISSTYKNVAEKTRTLRKVLAADPSGNHKDVLAVFLKTLADAGSTLSCRSLKQTGAIELFAEYCTLPIIGKRWRNFNVGKSAKRAKCELENLEHGSSELAAILRERATEFIEACNGWDLHPLISLLHGCLCYGVPLQTYLQKARGYAPGSAAEQEELARAARRRRSRDDVDGTPVRVFFEPASFSEFKEKLNAGSSLDTYIPPVYRWLNSRLGERSEGAPSSSGRSHRLDEDNGASDDGKLVLLFNGVECQDGAQLSDFVEQEHSAARAPQIGKSFEAAYCPPARKSLYESCNTLPESHCKKETCRATSDEELRVTLNYCTRGELKKAISERQGGAFQKQQQSPALAPPAPVRKVDERQKQRSYATQYSSLLPSYPLNFDASGRQSVRLVPLGSAIAVQASLVLLFISKLLANRRGATEYLGVKPSELVCDALAEVYARQMCDIEAVRNGSVPFWFRSVTTHLPFLLPLETKASVFKLLFAENAEKTEKFTASRDRIISMALCIADKAPARSIEVSFEGESGIGLGPTQEFYHAFAERLCSPALALWEGMSKRGVDFAALCKDADAAVQRAPSAFRFDGDGLFPRPCDWAKVGTSSPEGVFVVRMFECLGYFAAKAYSDGRLLDIPLSSAFFRLVLGHELSLHDVELFDPSVGRTLCSLQKSTAPVEVDLLSSAGLSNALTLTASGALCRPEDLDIVFTMPGDDDWELVAGGAARALDSENVGEYLGAVMRAFNDGVAPQVGAFKRGFSRVIDAELLRTCGLGEHDLGAVLCGGEDEPWSKETLRSVIVCDHGYTEKSLQVQHLIDVLSELDAEHRRLFVLFLTGTTRLPVGGFKGLGRPITVVRRDDGFTGPDAQLPTCNCCFFYFKLPPYSSKDVLEKNLYTAIENGQGSFDLS